MNSNNQNKNNDPVEPNESFSRDLKSLFGTDSEIPAGIDDAILSRARVNMPKRTKRKIVRWAGIGAAAAIVFIAIILNFSSDNSMDVTPTFAAEDINRSGSVDILDAFTLARAVEADSGFDKAWDINGDGVVDALDVDTVAMAAVTLDTGAI